MGKRDREATLEEADEREKCVGEKTRDNSSTEESEGENICSGTPILATHSYRKNQDSPLGIELDLQQGDTPSYILEHEDNEHWWLAEDSKGQVGYVPVSHLMIIMISSFLQPNLIIKSYRLLASVDSYITSLKPHF